MRSAADIEDVGWPDPAALLHRIESTRSCWAMVRQKSWSVIVIFVVGDQSGRLPRTMYSNRYWNCYCDRRPQRLLEQVPLQPQQQQQQQQQQQLRLQRLQRLQRLLQPQPPLRP